MLVNPMGNICNFIVHFDCMDGGVGVGGHEKG